MQQTTSLAGAAGTEGKRRPRIRLRLWRKKVSRSSWGNILLLLVILLFGLFMALPFIYAIIHSLKPMEEIFTFPPRFWVRRPTLDNYLSLGQVMNAMWVPLGRYVFNSVFVTLVCTGGHCLIAAMGAYPLAKMRFRGRRAINEIVTVSLLFTTAVTAFSQYIVMAKTNMIDTYWALLLPQMANPLGLFLLTNFMRQLPDSLIETAKIDGAGNFGIMWRIAIPNVRPAILTLIILLSQTVWNGDYSQRFIYDEALKLLPIAMNQIVVTNTIFRVGVGSAASVVIMIVPVTIFLVSQSRIIETMAFSGIKE